MTVVVSVQDGGISYFTATVFILILSDILAIKSNVTLSNGALTRSDFIRYDECLRYISGMNGMTQLLFSKYQHINRADELYCIIRLF